MDYGTFIKDELAKFRLVLNECGVVGDDWRKYMAVKIRLLKGQFLFANNPRWPEFRARVQPLVRMRDGKIVWFGQKQGDLLAKVSLNEFNLAAEPEKFVIMPNKVLSPIESAGKIKVCFPSENPEIFRPSAVCVFQQLPDYLNFWGLLFEVCFDLGDVRKFYDKVLQCHIAEVRLYYYSCFRRNLKQCGQVLPTATPEDLNIGGVREVNKPKEPEKPTKVIRTPQHSR